MKEIAYFIEQGLGKITKPNEYDQGSIESETRSKKIK